MISLDLNKDAFLKSIEKLKEQKDAIRKIINPFCSNKLNKKQNIELCHVGKFLTEIGDSEIIDRIESPDFIISYKNERIGLEHERIFIPGKVKIIQSIQNLFDDSAKKFVERYPDYKVLVNFRLTDSNFKIKKKDIEKLTNEISEYVYSLVSEQKDIKKPLYIEEAWIMKHSGVYFSYNPNAHFVEYLTPDILMEAIQKKENLVEKYIEKSNLKKQWLLIVIGSSSPDSYEYGDYPFTIDIISNFEKIFLMEDFNSKFWHIK